MEVRQILLDLDREIERLKAARALLTGESAPRKAGRKISPAKTKRTMSASGRRKIAEAMKRRWAERKKSAKS